MRDFEKHLGEQLAAAAPRVASRRAQRGRRARAGAGVVGVGAAVAVLAGLPGGAAPERAAAEIPALSRPQTMVPRAVMTDALRTVSVDDAAARSIETAFGTGYLVPSLDGKVLCLAIPDPVDGYGQTCAAVNDVRRSGLSVTMSSPQGSPHPSEVVIVLPAGAPAPTARVAGRAEELPVQQGVAVGTFREDTSVMIRTPDATSTVEVAGAEPEGDLYRDCGNERYVRVPEDFTGPTAPLCHR